MQDHGGFGDPDQGVSTPTVAVRGGGTDLPASAVSVSRELGTVLDGRVAGGGVIAASGSALLLHPDGPDVTLRAANPWDRPGGFPPVPGSALSVEAGYGDARVRVLTGSVDPGRGSATSQEVEVGLIDGIDRLDQTITIEPLVNAMPPRFDTVDRRRWVYLSPTYFTDRILRHCGFYATPPRSGSALMSAPLMGSAWPERGILRESSAAQEGSNTPSFASGPDVPWGMAAGSLRASYLIQTSPSYDGILDNDSAMTLTAMFGAARTDGHASAQVWWGSNGQNRLQLIASPQRRIYVETLDPTAGAVRRCELSAADVADAEVFSVQMVRVGLNINITLVASNGKTATGVWEASTPPFLNPVTSVEVATGHGTSCPIGGVQLEQSVSNVATRFSRTAHITRATYYQTLTASPALVGRNCLDLLREQAAAEFAAMWIDEHGHFRWVNREELIKGEPVATLTTDVDLQDLTWEDPPTPPGRVELSYRTPSVSTSPQANITVWQGRSQTFDPQQTEWEKFGPGADEDWIMVDADAEYAGAPTGGDERMNRGYDSWVGGYAIDEEGEGTYRWFSPTYGHGQMSLSQIDPVTWEYTADIYSLTAPDAQIVTEMSPQSVGLWPKWHGAALPIVRAKGKTLWRDRMTSADTGTGAAATLTHDAGWWVPSAGITDLRNWLVARSANPAPLVRDLPVTWPDPRLQLGDIVTVSDRSLTGVVLRVLIAGINLTFSESPDSYGMDQTLTGVVLSYRSESPTLGEHDAMWRDASMGQHTTHVFGDTLGAHDNDPLGGH